ncbi:MAG: HelD family protein [Actinomycetota bacterium]
MPDRPANDPEHATEQAYVDAAYARLEAMRAAAERVRAAYADVRQGGTHQARLERDIAWELTQRRLADLDIGDSPLVFGRLDMEDFQRWYIGRLAVEDAEHVPLVIDWRAPVAEPFYRATAVAPMNVVRRRHLLTKKGRDVTGLDDEVFDQAATQAAGLRVTGEGALLGALERNRTGRMGDIVATIQSEQDEAIRADMAGVLVVGGGPGTGKTAVALHRAAYLLYTHRRRLASSGVLLIGPSAVFLRYIEQVLPSLGEQDVQLSTVNGLKSRVRVSAVEASAVAALKGDLRMAQVIERAVADRERALRNELVLVLDGMRVRIGRGDTARIAKSARRRRGTHNEKRPYVARRVLELLVARYKTALVRSYKERRLDASDGSVTSLFDRDVSPDPTVAGALARGEAAPEGWEPELRSRLRTRPEVRDALDRMWPVLSGAELVHDLFGFRALVRSASGDLLTPDQQELLHRRHESDIAQTAWTAADVPLIDEADALLGPVEAARTRRKRRRSGEDALDTASRVIDDLGLHGFADAATLAQRYSDPATETSEGLAETRTYGHVLVDEAQDLTAMQWRMLARRVPSGSMTLVGDPGQASRPGAESAWDRVLSHLPTHNPPRFVTLSVNYRTPAEVMDIAARLLAVAAPTVEPSQSVRSTGEFPRFVPTEPGSLLDETLAWVRKAVERGGTIAVIAPTDLHGSLVDVLGELGAVADAAEALDAPVAVLDATAAKGLEFDHVVVVEPSQLVTPDRAGLRLLYVTITRTTKTLAIVHADALPEGLAPDSASA